MTLSDNTKVGMFKRLASHPLYDVGIYFELDKHYSTPKSIKNKVYNVYNEIRSDPQKFGLSQETVDLVVSAMSERKVAKHNPKMAEVTVDEEDIKSLTLGGRTKAARLINRKLDHLERSPKALKNESLVTLGKIFGILFDKSQIIRGEATEHVAHLAKIDPNLSPEMALEAIFKMREINQDEGVK